jgi:hypothetical protein
MRLVIWPFASTLVPRFASVNSADRCRSCGLIRSTLLGGLIVHDHARGDHRQHDGRDADEDDDGPPDLGADDLTLARLDDAHPTDPRGRKTNR